MAKEGRTTSSAARALLSQAERKKLEELTLLLDNIRIQVWCLTDAETYGAANRAHADFLGWKIKDLEGKSLRGILGRKEAKVCIAGNKKAFEKRKQIDAEEWLTDSKGRSRLLCITRTPEVDDDGHVGCVICTAEDITERKQVERALRESEERYRFLVNNSKEIALILSRSGKILFANRALFAGSDYSEEEIIGKSIEHFLTKNSARKALFALAQEFLGHSQPGIVIQARTRSGQIRHLEVTQGSTPVREKGKLIGLLITARDITEPKRRNLETEIRAQLLDRLRSAGTIEDCLQLGCEAILEAGLFERAVLTLHNEKREITHLGQVGLEPSIVEQARRAPAPDENLAKKITQPQFKISHSFFVPEEAGVAFEQTGRYVLPKSKTGDGEDWWKQGDELFVPMIRKDGQAEGYLSVDTPVDGKRPPKETILYLEGVVDMVAREIHEMWNVSALRESESKYASLVEENPAFIAEHDIEGALTYVNQTYTTRGYTKKELIGRACIELVHPDDRDKTESAIRQALTTGRASLELRSLAKDGTVYWVALHIQRLQDSLGRPTGFRTVAFDITERKRAEEALRDSEKRLREGQKMEAVGQLAGGIAHDFNNLLTAIQGYAQFALIKMREDDPVRSDIQEIQRSAKRAANLTRQLLLFSRRQPMELRVLSENSLIERMMKMLGRLIGEDITLETELGEGLWSVKADPGNIEQLIMNLVVNARDAMPEGGKILVKTENVVVDKEYCRAHTDARPGRFVCLSIKDAGMGMGKEALEHIFEPFFTTKGPGTGTGLGLAVVYGSVKQHDGWIEVESAVGQGTTFRVYLPMISTKSVEKPEADVVLEALRGRGERILLVEDEESVRRLAARALSENGYVVYSAGNAQEAMDIFQREEGRFDLIFCDVVLPDEPGPRLVDRLLELRPGSGVIFTSGYSDEKSGWRNIQNDGYPYIQKPYSLSGLIEVVSDTLRRKEEVE